MACVWIYIGGQNDCKDLQKEMNDEEDCTLTWVFKYGFDKKTI